MAFGEVQPEFAFNVCVRCKGRKKGCDKILPSCSRCSRLQVRCRYPSLESTPPESDQAGSDNYIATYQTQGINFFPELIAPFSFITPHILPSIHSGERRVLSLDEQLTEQCCDIMSRDGDDVLASCSRYFSSVHIWLPIINKDEFYDRLSRLRSSPVGDFSILVMTVYLNGQMCQEVPRERDSLEQLYYTIKGFYCILISTGRSSTELVQAGILLALYEHHQARHDVTYQTLGACARMGYTLGFDKALSQGILPDLEANSIIERQRHIWWGIIILERISMLEYIDKKLPFAIPTPLITDILPLDNGIKYPASQGLSSHGASSDTPVELSIYARIAQGGLLLSYVIDRVNNSNPTSSSCGAAHLDKMLRSYAMALLQPNGLDHLCWPYSICLSALLILNHFEVSVEPKPEEAHERHLFQSRAVLGLQSVLRMILDGTGEPINVSNAQKTAVPIWCFHRAYLAAVLILELGVVDDDREKWTGHIQTAKFMLKTMGPRCKLAGDYLKSIEDAESH